MGMTRRQNRRNTSTTTTTKKTTVKTAANPYKSWREFTSANLTKYTKSEGSFKKAMARMGREWQSRKA